MRPAPFSTTPPSEASVSLYCSPTDVTTEPGVWPYVVTMDPAFTTSDAGLTVCRPAT